MRTARILALAGTAVLAIAACGGATATTAPAAATSAAATSAAATSAAATSGAGGGEEVAIADFSFTPQTVTASVGTTVTWTNDGQQPHTVKWSDGTPESEQLGNGDTYERTFDAAGTFDYICGIHPQMTGSVTVE